LTLTSWLCSSACASATGATGDTGDTGLSAAAREDVELAVIARLMKLLTRRGVLVEDMGQTWLADPDAEGEEARTLPPLQAAAVKRHKAFFGYAKNIFIGDSSVNRQIQEHLDKDHPEMASKQLREHVRLIKRGWALDSSFKPSEDK